MTFTAFGPIYRAAALLLPPKLDTQAAWAQLYAIGRQESRLDARRQIGGPARGFWQFEKGGIQGVLNHPASQPLIFSVLDALDYDRLVDTSYTAIEHNDVLAFAYARCLLWTLAGPLPGPGDPDTGWAQYTAAWRPGTPRRQTWNAFYAEAWQAAPTIDTKA